MLYVPYAQVLDLRKEIAETEAVGAGANKQVRCKYTLQHTTAHCSRMQYTLQCTATDVELSELALTSM